MALATVVSDTPIQSSVYNLHVGAHSGTSGAGQPLVNTDIGSAAWIVANPGVAANDLWAATFRNQGTLGQALRVQNAAGTTIFSVSDAGVSLSFADGSVTAPGIAFTSDLNNGLYRDSTDAWSMAAGGIDVIKVRRGTLWGQVGMGNVGEPGVSGGQTKVLHIHHQSTASSDGDISASYFELTNNASTGGAGAVPDSSAMSAVIYQSTAAADGAIRAVEAHAIRGHASAGANANSTCMGAEIGTHSLAAGNASFPNASGAAPKNIGIYLTSADASGFAGAVRADVGLLILGARGFKSGIHWVDTDGTTVLFDVGASNGTIRMNTAGNAAAPQLSFFTDQDTGVFWGGTNVLAFAAGTVEFARGGTQAFQITTGQVLAGIITPTQIAANTNNWNPTGLGTARIIRATTDASRNLTGIVALAGGTVLAIQNAGATQNLVLTHNDTGQSATGNCFMLPNNANLTLLPGMGVEIYYDSTSSKWRCLSGFVS